MATINTSELRRPDGNRPGQATGRGRPIGSESQSIRMSARRSIFKRGDVLFEGEELIVLYPATLRTLVLADGQRHGAFRFEVKANPKADSAGPQKGDHLIVTEWPYGNGWYMFAEFKPGSHRDSADRQIVDARTVEEAMARLDAAHVDPWETGDFLTATLRPPEPIAVFDDPWRKMPDPHWLFGVCRDPKEAVLVVSRGKAAQKLLQLAREGRLLLGPNQIPIHPRVAENANATLFLAIQQALAGPRVTTELVGEPVFPLAKFIFEDHLYNATRRANREDGRIDE